jgi:predicted dehydrogenase
VAGGGPIADVGVHCIDALRYVLQDEPTLVSTVARSDEHSGDVEASAILSFEFRKGTLATVLVSTRAHYRTPFEVVGDGGVLRVDDALKVERSITVQLWRGGELVSQDVLSNQFAYAKQVDSFAVAVEGRGIFPVSGEEGLKNQTILDCAYRSLFTGKTEAILLGAI